MHRNRSNALCGVCVFCYLIFLFSVCYVLHGRRQVFRVSLPNDENL